MRKTELPLATMMAALLASVLILATTVNPARAAFPGKNGKITFLSDRDGNNEIYTISFRNGEWGNAKRLTSSAKSDKIPSFSPNGKKIAWERGDNLYKMDANGTNQRKIPNTTHFRTPRAGSPQQASASTGQTGPPTERRSSTNAPRHPARAGPTTPTTPTSTGSTPTALTTFP